MKTFVKNYRQAPRKVRLLADLVRGKNVERALTLLTFSDKRASLGMIKALKAAVANARAQGKETTSLFVKEISVNKGVTMRRSMPRARGSASPIRRHSSHIAILLGEK